MAYTVDIKAFNSMIRIISLSDYMKLDTFNDNADSPYVLLPISPNDIMYTEDSESKTVQLINYGELPVSMNRKLATWTISSYFPARYISPSTGSVVKLPWDLSDGQLLPYDYYCNKLLGWKNAQTPLVFLHHTWGSPYYAQIKNFKYGNKDSYGNVYYDMAFQEYKKYDTYDESYATTDYSSDTYYPAPGETILSVAKKIYGNSAYYTKIMSLNSMSNPQIKAGQALKIR